MQTVAMTRITAHPPQPSMQSYPLTSRLPVFVAEKIGFELEKKKNKGFMPF
jgi:hypothetical protein